MFDRLIESTNERRSARTWFFFAASSVVWSVVLAGVAIAGVLMADARLDADFSRLSPVPVAPSAPAAPRTRSSQPERPRDPASSAAFVAIVRPRESLLPPRPPALNTGPTLPGAIDGGNLDATGPGLPDGYGPGRGGTTDGDAAIPVPAPPPSSTDLATQPPAPPAPPRPKHIGIISGLATRRVEPPYPPMAQSIGIQGAVVVSVTVSETGRVLEAHAVSGHPTLRQASIDAARRWQFSPTMLNGIPIKVIGTITFNFRR